MEHIEISSSPIFIMRDSKYIKTYYLLICIIIVAVNSVSNKSRDAKKYHFYFNKFFLSMFFQPLNQTKNHNKWVPISLNLVKFNNNI